MKTYWDMTPEERTKIGVDYGLSGCLEYNPQNTFDLGDVEKVLPLKI